ncbi:hypothetical protein Poli38472_004661 [Pythium oligandrum]|uniref:Aquaporin n=1 Tax=Pythium oligandrum TaxID=41045 RepID=A0A8K1CC16_PYTOL|nr:hypothetical protein Poli38472_004661 [Pythium oligandrum]|eukprot:TMW59592.1 hypothetical protein Poli38472_004661 [Pythium oligandrum]
MADHREEATLSHQEAGLVNVVNDKPEADYVGLTDGVSKKPRFAVSNPHLRECLAEFLGTFVMMVFGVGVNNQVTVSEQANGIYLSISMGWGIAVLLGIHASGGVSGAHLNPAVSTSFALFGKFPWRKVPGYIISQLLGSFVACCFVYILYYQRYDAMDPDRMTTQGTYATYPNADISIGVAFYTEVFATAMLIIGLFSIGDAQNQPAHPSAGPLHVMLLIWAIGMALGTNTGYALNPARDFPPRLFTAIAGWGSKVFTTRNYFWVPIVGPVVGGAIGGFVYKLFIENHHPKQD